MNKTLIDGEWFCLDCQQYLCGCKNNSSDAFLDGFDAGKAGRRNRGYLYQDERAEYEAGYTKGMREAD